MTVMISEYIVIGIVIAGASGYLLSRIIRTIRSKQGACGGGMCRCGEGSANQSDRRGKRIDLVQVGIYTHDHKDTISRE